MSGKIYAALLALPFATSAWVLHAEVVTDGSVGPAQNLAGPDFIVPENIGSRAGDNLFHSFEQFNVLVGETATFTGSSDITNVISRVTGVGSTTIQGLLKSEVGTADFFFLNPDGVFFGNGAQVDVPAGLHISTANELILEDDSRYRADLSQSSTLSISPPSAFGFAAGQTGRVQMDSAELNLGAGRDASFSASQIDMNDSIVRLDFGSIKATTVGDSAAVLSLVAAPEINNGEMNLNNSTIELGSGRLVVNAGALTLVNDSDFTEVNFGNQDATQDQGIVIDVGSLDLLSSNINLLTTNGGNGSDATITAGAMRVDGQGSQALTGVVSQATSGSTGNAGSVSISVTDLLEVLNGGAISSGTVAEGNAGNVLIDAGTMRVDGQGGGAFTGVDSRAASGSTGNAGRVEVSVTDLLEVSNGGSIASSTFAEGDAGSVIIDAGALRVDDQGSAFFTGVASTAEAGSIGTAGKVEITVTDLLEVLNGGQISSSTFAEGDAGNIVINAGALRVDNQGSALFTGVDSRAASGSTGNAGRVEIRVTDLLEVLNGGAIGSGTFAEGDAGSVIIDAGVMRVDDQGSEASTVVASSAELGSIGNAGRVEITVTDLLEVLNGGQILSSTFAAGNAGSVIIDAGVMRVDAADVSSSAFESIGNAGSVEVTVIDLLEVLNGGQISSSTFAEGDAGSIIIDAGAMRVNGQGSEDSTGVVSRARSGSTGNAGRVEISVTDLLEVLNGAQISSSTFAAGDAGSLMVDTQSLLIDAQNSETLTGIFSQSNNVDSGRVGNVQVNATDTIRINDGVISIKSLSERNDLVGAGQGLLSVSANEIQMQNDAEITAESIAGIPASNVQVSANGLLQMVDSVISSTAEDANGGGVTLAANTLLLENSQVTTSVNGATAPGSGGDISLNASALILDTGFVQANTTGNQGGNVIVEADFLINLGNNLVTGGAPATFSRDSGVSVIQASAVGDLVGNIELDAPEFDLSGEISPLRQQLLSADAIDQHPCAQSDASSLASSGSGGLPTSPAGYLSFRSDSGAVSSSSRSSSTNTQQIVSNMVQARLCEHGVL